MRGLGPCGGGSIPPIPTCIKAVKFCRKCGTTKPLSDFNRAQRRTDGVQSYCRLCQRVIDKTFYHANEDRRTRTKTIRAAACLKAQRYVLDYLLSHPCVDCEETDVVVLDFDHLDDKLYNVSDMISHGFSVTSIQREIAKCEVRCANCHRRMTAKRHGGWWKTLGVEPVGTAADSKPAIDSVRF